MATSRLFRFRKPSLVWIATVSVIATTTLASAGCHWMRAGQVLPTCTLPSDEVQYYPGAGDFKLGREADILRAKQKSNILKEPIVKENTTQ